MNGEEHAKKVRRNVMLAGFDIPEPTKAYCGNCRGKGFDCMTRKGARHARKCQRCRGRGYVEVGNTKR